MRRGVGDRGATALAVPALVLAMLTAACGLGGDDGSGGVEAVRHGLQVPTGMDDGCGDQATTNVDDVASNRQVARCAAEAPEPQALPAPATLRVGVRAPTEDVAPVLLADRMGAFEEENLTVELVELDDPAELFGALERGEIDVVAGDLDAAFFDAVHRGSGARLVLGGAVAPAAGDLGTDQPGLWVRRDVVSPPERWRDLMGHPIAVQDGIGDVVVDRIASLFRQDDLSLEDVNLVRVDGATAVDLLLQGEGGVSAAWLSEPDWREVADRGAVRLVATLPAEPLGGVVMAGRLLDEAQDRAVGMAFVRAVIRTVNTHLADDYQSDDDVVAELAEATGQSEDEITATPGWVFDWELRQGTTNRIQRTLVTLGGVLYEQELPESQVVDRSLYRDAVGA
jgi:NitT/TauT family transport system substrate-binding protein